MGDIVIYRTGRHDESYPAIIVQVHTGDRADLTIFSTTGIRHAIRVPFNSALDATQECWHWGPDRDDRRRPIERTEKLDTEKVEAQTAEAGSEVS